MGFGSLFQNAGRRITSWWAKAREPGLRRISSAIGIGGSAASVWTQDRHEQARHFRGWAYIAIRAIAMHMAMDEPRLAMKVPTGTQARRKILTPYERAKSIAPVGEGYDLEHVDDEHPLRRLFADPNEPDTGFDLAYERELWWALCGVAYMYTPRNRIGLPGELWVIPSPWVRPKRETGSRWVDTFEVRPYGSSTGGFDIDPRDMVVFADKGPWSKFDGYSALTAGSEWIDASTLMNQLRLRGMMNGAYPSLALDADSENFVEPDDEELERILAKAKARFQGPHNAGAVTFSRNGIKTNALPGVSAAEVGFLNSDPQLRDAVLSLFGVPYTAAMIVGGATHENYDESMRAFHHTTINPRKRRVGQILTEKLARQYDERLCVYYPDTTPIDPAQQLDEVTSLHGAYMLTPNEGRKRYGLDPIQEEWADIPGGKPPGAEESVNLQSLMGGAKRRTDKKQGGKDA